MHKIFFGVVAIFLLSGQHTEAQSFNKTQVTISPEPGVYSNLEWVDLDGDNDLDIVELYSDTHDAQQRFVKIYQNDNQVFAGVANAFGGETVDPRSYDFGDFDSDGDIDILFLDSEAVKIAVNNGSLSFSIQNTSIDNSGNWTAGVHWQDLDGDLDIDIVFDIFIYMNNAGTYSPALYNMPSYTSNRSWADINNDGLVDMVAAKGQSYNINPLFVFVNQGSGLFKEIGQLSAAYRDTGRTLWLDADADDDLDLLVTEDDNKTTLFKNTFSESGEINFERSESFRAFANPHVDIGDINLDGLPDIILSGQGASGYQTYLYLNAASGTEIAFAETELQVNPYYITNFDLLDADGDFDLDLFVTGWFDNGYTVREQHAYKVNPPNSRPSPSVPVNLISAVESDVTLTWDHNDNNGAAYFAIALKRNGVPFSPRLALSNGKLLMPDLLDLRTTKETTLRDLPAGNYEWQVQAYDHAFRVSGFSASNAFTITAAPTNVTLDVLAYDRVKINWQFTGTATHFAVLRRSTNGALKEIGTVPGGIANFIDEDVPPNEHIEYIVKAISNGVYSAPSSSVAYYSAQFEQVSFNPTWPVIITASGVSADFDSDQNYDLGFAGYIGVVGANSTTLINNGTGQYAENTFLPDYVDESIPLIAKDMDNDGDIDICAVVGSVDVGHKVTVYKNNGATFTKSFQTSSYSRVSQLSSEDVNNDGLPDLVIKRSIGNAASGMPTYHLLYQTQAGSFADSKIEFLKEFNNINGLGDFYLTDLNNDGFIDIVFTGAEYDVKSRVFVNLMGQAFAETPLTFELLTNPVFFDLNGDGKTDIIQRGLQRLYVYNGLGNLVFDEPYEIPVDGLAPYENIEVKIADLDFNGWPDLIVNDNQHIALLHNTGYGNFVRADYPFAGDWATHTFLTDMEGDGDLDLVKQGNDRSNQDLNYFYKNRGSSAPGDNAAPSAPTSIHLVRAKNAITLSWAPSADDTTPAEFISYHVQIKDNNGKTWLHAETNATGNFRRRLAFGNAGFRTSYTINHLPAGQYTAYIQAVDASFKLSLLSSAFQFQITAGPTNLAAERILLNKVKLTWNDGPFVGTKTVVERKSLNSDFEVVAELPANATEYVDDELVYDNLYTYQVYEVVGGITTAGSNLAAWNTSLLLLQPSTLVNIDGSLDVGDYTGDGKMDLAIHGGRTYNGITLDFTNALFEKTVAGWTRQNVGPTTPHNGTTYFYDINGDHKPDLFQYGYFYAEDEYRTQVFLNNGNKTFTETTTPFTADHFKVNGTWDYDRDNDLDYLVQKPDFLSTLLKNNGSGNFMKDEAFGACCQALMIAGDFDHDGDEDIIQSGSGSNHYELLLNKDGALHRNASLPAAGGGIQALDYNADGLLDLLVVSGNSTGSKLYKNVGPDDDGVIQFHVIQEDLPSGQVSANAADYDHDGDVDIFFTGSPSVMLNNEGSDVFRENIIPELSSVSNETRWVDFDSDGDLDLFVMGYLTVDFQEGVDQPYAYVLNNQLIVSGEGIANQPPAAPTGLSAHQDVNGMHLTWTSQPDDHTSPEALTHDVVLYKDGKEIVKGPLNPSTEKRYKLENGRSAGLSLIDNLPYGAYTWKVQSIDQSYLGSPLSVAGQFTFIPQPPVMKDTIIYRCDRVIVLSAEGSNIEWYSDQALTQKVGSGNYSPQASQTVYVTQTVDGMRGVARPVKIDIYDRPEKPVPVINPYLYCESNAGNIATIQVSGNDVQWYKDADKKNGAGSGYQLLIKLSETAYYATQTLGGCESLPAEVLVKPVVIDSEIYLQDDKVYTAEENGTAYQWYRNNVPVPNSNNYFVDAVNPSDTYSVLIQKEGCSELSEATIITAIEEKESDGLKVYPNPASENFTIEVPAISNEILKIYDVAGQVVYEKTLSEKTIHTLKIHSATWSSGVYFITLTNERDTRVRKIVIK